VSRRVDRLRDEIEILEYRAGNTSALEKLISRWQAPVYWYLLTMVEDRSAVWDVSQEVWLATVRGLARLKRTENFTAWLYSIAHNKAVSYLRKKRLIADAKDLLLESAPESYSSDPDPSLLAEDASMVHECLHELPLPQRECLSLFYLDDLSLDEIARVLEVPRGTVQSRLHHGRVKMKELLVRKGYDHEQR